MEKRLVGALRLCCHVTFVLEKQGETVVESHPVCQREKKEGLEKDLFGALRLCCHVTFVQEKQGETVVASHPGCHSKVKRRNV